MKVLLPTLAILACCAPAVQEAPSRKHSHIRAFFIESESWGAYTACGTKEDSWYPERTFDLDTAEIAGLRVHEEAHRIKMAEFPSCDAHYAWIETPPNWLMNEAFAFCAQAHTLYAHGKHTSLDAAFAAMGKQLMDPVYDRARLGWPLTPQTAADLISISCKVKG